MFVACPGVLLASSRPKGNTFMLARMTLPPETAPLFDLAESDIGYYSYEGTNADDGFLLLVEKLLAFPVWVLATPLYWYTMSAQAKTFLDRLSDLLAARKELGRKLRGKSFAVVCAGTDPQAPTAFTQPFELTCEYLGMRFLGSHYCQFSEQSLSGGAEASLAAAEFGRTLAAEASNHSIEATS